MRTNWIESEFALINGAPTFLTLADSHHRPHEVTLTTPLGVDSLDDRAAANCR